MSARLGAPGNSMVPTAVQPSVHSQPEPCAQRSHGSGTASQAAPPVMRCGSPCSCADGWAESSARLAHVSGVLPRSGAQAVKNAKAHKRDRAMRRLAPRRGRVTMCDRVYPLPLSLASPWDRVVGESSPPGDSLRHAPARNGVQRHGPGSARGNAADRHGSSCSTPRARR